MKKSAIAGTLLAALALAGCSDSSGEPTTIFEEVSPDPTTTDPTDAPSEEPTEGPSEDPTESPTDDRSEDPTTVPPEQGTTPVEFDTDAQLPPSPETGVTLTWTVPGETFHIYTRGSSTDGCYPVPTEAWTDGETIEITFDPANAGLNCTTDIVTYGWEVTWDVPIEVGGEIEVTLTDVLGMGHTLSAILPAEPGAPVA
ncbi:MAG: hypothetical protein ACTHUY_07830 [Flaviflexus sp.]|uniref:hypothetical protein n=1 Tax=Flaviflexus sp. TaxID=1969482 RepID=UPI003F90DBD3